MQDQRWKLSVALAALWLASACSGGGGSTSSSSAHLAVTNVNLLDGAVWRINRRIEVTFNKPIDVASISLTTFNVRRVGGAPASGEFTLENGGRTVVFQPHCPTRSDLADAGLLAGLDGNGPYRYELSLLGASSHAGLSLRATDGDVLENSLTRNFTTPTSLVPDQLYFDPHGGPPLPRVIGDAPDNDASNSCAIEIGGGASHPFVRQPDGSIALETPLELPLNALSDAAQHVAFLVRFDQPIDPAASNLAELRLEYRDFAGAWQALAADATLEANCTAAGAVVRLVPRGLLPGGTLIRALVTPELRDLVGQTSPVALDRFAVAPTQPNPVAPQLLSDEVLEDFDANALEDRDTPFAEPRSRWQAGELGASFDFGGTNTALDWYIAPGSTVIFNTSSSAITGGTLVVTQNGVSFTPTGSATFVGGVVDVNDFYVADGATLKIEGPNPFLLTASGEVTIEGTININGSASTGVSTLGTTNLSEAGAPGQAGGGRGGDGHPLLGTANPRGGDGSGPFNSQIGGGRGGETGWSTLQSVDARRGGGGGGGRFGADVASSNPALGAFDQSRIGLDAEPGFDNPAGDNGAITGVAGPFGGASGVSPFTDPDPSNDFYGSMFDTAAQRVVRGELVRPWAGSGGGGGGDSVNLATGATFPGTLGIGGYQKGAGAGGGGGSFRLLALGSIQFVGSGRILCRGGSGGGGENTNGTNRVGGGSGGGSGGHVILESASDIDFRSIALTNTTPILATGGQGGAGRGNVGGARLLANGIQETPPGSDACPPGYPSSASPNGCLGQVPGTGGDGGPGLIQLHTSTGVIGTNASTADILVPVGSELRTLCSPPPLCAPSAGSSTSSCYLLASFGRLSRARSKWIALGLGAVDANSPTLRDVEFALEGLDPTTGQVRVDANGNVLAAAPWLGPLALGGNATSSAFIVAPGGREIVLDASALLGTDREAALTNTNLLLHAQVELTDGATSQRYDVVAASYDAPTQRLRLVVDGDQPALLDFEGATHASLLPAFFRVRVDDTHDVLPPSATIQVRWQAARADAFGGPDESTATAFTADPALLNATPNGDLRFVRFDVLFDVNAQSQKNFASNPKPALEFLRLPFLYR